MFGTLTDEIEVKVPAGEAWKLYGSLKLAEVVREELPDVVQRVDVLEGDGGPGTKLMLTFPTGSPIAITKEEFVVVDDKNMVKVTEVFEGGFLNLGLTLYRVTFAVVPNPNDEFSCTTKAILEYEYKDDDAVAAANVSFVTIQPLTAILNAAAKYLNNLHHQTSSTSATS